jgi:hypothetical protein
MKLIKINDSLMVNPDRVDFLEQKKDGVVVSIGGRIVPITSQEDLTSILKDLYGSGDNLWGKQYFAG